jgi:hypothetical protein
MYRYRTSFLILVIFIVACSCTADEDRTLFTRLPETATGITFRNLLKEDNEKFNILTYPYFYNGGGVAVGDLNNDNLPDVFFTGNMVKNRLYFNKGDLEFEDITSKSTVAEKEGWCTGATMVDINEDGWLDIYVCRSGLANDHYRKNLLFVNNQDLTFTESAAKYGLDDMGYSTQASFFDYDLDNDLDVIIINQSLPQYAQGQIEYAQLKNQQADSVFKNKLLRNDNGKFIDVSQAAGIKSNVLTFSLGVSTSDINQDGWPDVFITNDFKEPDHYYINNRDGTFTESISKIFDHTSLYAMGVDVADYNNDLLSDILILDMLPESNAAQKMHSGGDNYTQYNFLFKQGMFHQYMKNSLQKNNGDGTFSEIGQLAGVSNTDWSWSPLIADLDNDGLKDIFITNGYKRDNTDIEFIIYSMNQSIRLQKGGDALNVSDYISHMQGINLPNYIFKNNGNDTFENKVNEWGLDHNTYSHGSAYADLDSDGDLDLITNNTEDFAGIYRNNADKVLKNNYIKFKLKGIKENAFAIGTKIFAYKGNNKFFIEQSPVRGFQSSSDFTLHLGLGNTTKKLDSIRIVWPDQTFLVLRNVAVNTTLNINQKDHIKALTPIPHAQNSITLEMGSINFIHKQKDENDFLKQFLIPHYYSQRGPCMAKGDINSDGLADFFISGGRNQPSKIFIQKSDKTFGILHNPSIEIDSAYLNNDATFFDADNDGDLDLYLVSGGYELETNSPLFRDRLYLNNGKGLFSASTTSAPKNLINKSSITAGDFDSDGDVDVFIGGHVKPQNFPLNEKSTILLNDGNGNFSDAPFNIDLSSLGIVNDVAFKDINADGFGDLIIASEWQPLRLILGGKNAFTRIDSLKNAGRGLWTTVLVEDLDSDGDNDILAGNYGLNSQLKTDKQHPVKLYFNDFDENGSIDPIITHYIGDKSFPLVARDDLNGQIPPMKKKFNDYKTYANATIHEILNDKQLKEASLLSVDNLNTVFLENTVNGYEVKELPIEVQYAPVYAIAALKTSKSSRTLIFAGNNSKTRISLGRHDASHGVAIEYNNKKFRSISQRQSGLNLKGDVRDILTIDNNLLFGINNEQLKFYQVVKH